MLNRLKSIILVVGIAALSNIVFALETANYYGTYDLATKKPWRVATSLTGPHKETWVEPTANRPYKIGVLLPHVQNSYWLAVNEALIKEAEKLQINLKIFQAGGYSKGGVQRKQLTEELLLEKVDGIVLASIFYDKLDRFIAQIDKMGTPVIALLNDILSPNVKAKVGMSHYEIGCKIGDFILDDAAGKDSKIAFFPGPKTAAWATEMYAGCLATIKENAKGKPVGKIKIVAVQYDAMMVDRQQLLVDKVLDLKANINYIIGNDLAVIAASTLVHDKYKKAHPDAKIIASVTTADIYEAIKSKKIYAGVIDSNMEQARMALHLMVRYLNGDQANKQDIKFPFCSAPFIEIINHDNATTYKPEQIFGSKNFQPTYEFVVPAKASK